ncbi:hypothetical protein FQN51_001683 [Onygenales sp. PD_10]|nr:hypothetical protein FQN51_001683 [Onygenales sp. PD_10]
MKRDIDEAASPDEDSGSDEGEIDQMAVETLHGSLKKRLRTSQFTDLIIKTREKEHKVHKIIICGQSTVFSRMLSGDWKEANEGVVSLMDDRPAAVEAMINFMYTFKYCYTNVMEWNTALFHFRVYEVAEKYSVASLELLAMQKVEEILKSEWGVKDFLQLVEQVYLSASSAVGTLRKTIYEEAYLNMGCLLDDPDFLRLLQEMPDFRTDFGRFSSSFNDFTCPACKAKSFLQDGFSMKCCPSCTRRTSLWK